MSEQTYTPGMTGRKTAAVVFGALVVLFGLWWLMHPLGLLFFGAKAQATVVYVLQEKPGQEPVRLDTRKKVEDAEDPTRNAVYSYHIQFEGEAGDMIQSTLNYAQVRRPGLSIGDTVRIRYDRQDPADVIHVDSVRTWAFGCFFVAVGLLLFLPQLFILLHARKPIVVDSIKPLED